MERILKIVDKNFLNKKKNKKIKNNIYSMSYIVNRNMSQSQCIKLGLILENIFRDIILEYSNYTNIKEKNSKNVREKDHLFLDLKNKTVYYAEIKTNMYLDTEKSKATEEKCSLIRKELVEKYPEFKIKSKLVCLRYTDIIPKTILNKYKEKVYNVNEYFKSLGIKISFQEEKYKIFINYIANKMD